ncbi:MAG: hypothetical protein ABJO67_08990 [Pseudoruegeria sp.]
MRKLIIFMTFWAAPFSLSAQAMPALDCESVNGNWFLGLYGPVARLRSPEVKVFSATPPLRPQGSDWPVYILLSHTDQKLTVRLEEYSCSSSGDLFPIQAEILDPSTNTINLACCTVVE